MSAALSPRLVAEIEAIVTNVERRTARAGASVPAQAVAMPVDGLFTAEMEAYATQNVPPYRAARLTTLLVWLTLIAFSAAVIGGTVWLAWRVTR